MIGIVHEMISYPFIFRAIIVGLGVSLCSSVLGVSLVLKHYSMIGDGLSHVGFGALALAVPLNAAPLEIALPVVAFAAFVLLRISQESKIQGDAALALVSTGALAFGVLVLSMTTGMNTDVCNYLFGSILSMSKTDVRISIALSVMVIFLFVFFYNQIFSITFDEEFARASGLNVKRYNSLIAILTAVVIVLGMRMMGALLISGLIVLPALSSMAIYRRFKHVVIASAIISSICFLIGMYISYAYSTPTGAGIVAVNFMALFLANIIEKIKGGPLF